MLTVPLPQRVLLVVLLSLGAAPLQFVVFRWSLAPATIVASLSLAVAAIGMAWVLGRLPAPRPTVVGAWRVVGEWALISAAAVLGIAVPATIFGIFPEGFAEWFFMASRMSYRFLLPGLAVVASHGLVTVAQRRLDRANEALEQERRRRVEILAESSKLDRDVAEALHRTVQGRLAAAVVMLRLGQRREAWEQVVEMANVEIPGLFRRLGGVEPETLIVDGPIGLSIVQVGDVTIRGEMLSDVQSVLGEIAANARRHGRASTLVIQASRCDDRLRLVCEDDGIGVGQDVVPGLGTRLLDEVMSRYGGEWHREPTGLGCRIVVDLPLPASPRSLASSAV